MPVFTNSQQVTLVLQSLLLGVRLYTALGADLTALYRFNLIDLGVRILSTLGLVWRYQKAKKDEIGRAHV